MSKTVGNGMKKHFVHRYKYSHDKRRAQFKKWSADGKVKKVGQTKDGWIYEETRENPLKVIGHGNKKRFQLVSS